MTDDQIALRRIASAQHDVKILPDQIDEPVGQADIEMQVRIVGRKACKQPRQQQGRQLGWHADA